MNENNVFDDISRTLASTMPRRQAFRQIVRGLAGAALISVFGVETARAAGCPPGKFLCGGSTGVCCNQNQICCGTGHSAACCNQNQTCDNGKCKQNVSQPATVSTGI